MPAREPLVLLTLEVAQVVAAPVLADVRVMRRLGPARPGARPDQLPPIVVDVRPRVDIAVGRDEDVARGDELRAEDLEVYYWRVEVGSLSGGREVSMMYVVLPEVVKAGFVGSGKVSKYSIPIGIARSDSSHCSVVHACSARVKICPARLPTMSPSYS